MRKLFPIVFALTLLAAAPALAGTDSCFRRNDIREWASPQARMLILQADSDHKVLLQLTSGCSGFGLYDGLAISGPVESSMSCVSAGDTVHTTYAGEPGICRILSVTPYQGKLPPRISHL